MEDLIGKILNKQMKKEYPWWINFNVTRLKFYTLRAIFVIEGDLEVNYEWFKSQYEKYNTQPLSSEEISLNSIINPQNEEKIKEKINNIVHLISGYNSKIHTLSGIHVIPKINICNILNVNNLGELLFLIKNIEIHNDDIYKIYNILEKLEKDYGNLSSKYDILDTYLHEVQDVICKRKYPDF